MAQKTKTEKDLIRHTIRKLQARRRKALKTLALVEKAWGEDDDLAVAERKAIVNIDKMLAAFKAALGQ